MKRISMLVLCCLMASRGYALFCPGNFSQIELGDTLANVKAKCGDPAKQKTESIPPPTPQEWTYYIPQTVSAGMSTQQQGTLKVNISFDADGKALNINVNGIGVGASTICGNSIQLGDKTDAVKSACGKPSFINQQPSDTKSNQKNDEQTTYTYGGDRPATLIFKNGILSKVQDGS